MTIAYELICRARNEGDTILSGFDLFGHANDHGKRPEQRFQDGGYAASPGSQMTSVERSAGWRILGKRIAPSSGPGYGLGNESTTRDREAAQR